MDNFYFFGLNLGKLPNYVQYFGSNIVEGVAENWVEVEMSLVELGGAGWSWVELGARFSNTHLKKVNLESFCDEKEIYGAFKISWAEVSISLPQLQIGLSVSWKPCLILCSQRWKSSLVSINIPKCFRATDWVTVLLLKLNVGWVDF